MFFREGGNLISGLPSRVAFKATNGKGYPVKVKGALYQDDILVTLLESSHDGMGIFFFTPDTEKEIPDRVRGWCLLFFTGDLPTRNDFKPIQTRQEKFGVFISQTEGSPAQEVCLVGQVRGMICCVAKGC